MTSLLNDQEAAQKQIVGLQQQQFDLQNKMNSSNTSADEYQAAAAQLVTVNNDLQRQQSIVSYISDVLNGLEKVRLDTISSGIDFTKVQKQVGDLSKMIETLHEVKPDFDTSVMEAQLKDLTAKVAAFQAAVKRI